MRLERYESKDSRTVLRGGDGGNAVSLPDTSAASYGGVISEDPSPYISIAAVAGDEAIWWGTEEEGLPITGSVFTHYFSTAFGNPEADTDTDGLVSIQEAASLAEAQQRAYIHDVVLTVPRFVESFHRAGVSPEKDPA